MAQTAESINVELEARLAKFNADVRAGRINFDAEMVRISQSAGKAEKVITDSLGKLEKPFMSAATRSRQLGIQIGQLGSSLGSGMNPMTVFAQQAQDFTYVLGGTGGAAGKLATFFSGPWGAALLAAGIVVGTLASKLDLTGNALDDQVDKLRKHAAQAKLSEEANRVFANSLEGVEDAMRKTKDAMDALNDSQKTQTRLALEGALASLERLKNLRVETQALLDHAEAQYTDNESSARTPQERDIATFRVREAGLQIAAQRERLSRIAADIATTEGRINQLTARFVAEVVSKNADPLEALHNRFDKLVDSEAARLAKTGLVGAALEKEVQARTKILRLQEQSEEKALQAAKRTQQGVEQISSFIMPVSGPITSGFGARRPPTRGASSFHPAIDIGAPAGTPVKAAAGGVVITTGRLGGLGNVVIIDHGGGTISEYGHLSAIAARRGQRVEQGDIIGNVGSTGISTGPHLDYRVRVGGRYVDPRGGRFRTDEIAAGQRAQQLAAQAEREAQQQAARTAAYNNEMAQLEQQLLGASRTKLLSATEQLDLSEQEIIAQRDRNNSAYASAVKSGRIDQAQADLLTAKNNELATARTMKLYADEGVRIAEMNAKLDEARQQAVIAGLQEEVRTAKTGAERREASLRLLDAEMTLERIALERVRDATAAGTAEHELAVLKLAQLGDERARRAAAINRDPNNMGPGGQFLQSLQRTSAEIGEDLSRVAVNGLKTLDDQLLAVAMHTQSLGGLFKSVANSIISDLLRIAIQQTIIKPIAQLLFGGQGGGGGVGGIFGSILGLVSGGGSGGGIVQGGGTAGYFARNPFGGFRAGGGPVSAGKDYWVGENGPERFRPTQSGTIFPNMGRLGGPGGGMPVVEVHVVANEYFDARVGQVTGPVIARASVSAAQGGSMLARQKLLNSQIHSLG